MFCYTYSNNEKHFFQDSTMPELLRISCSHDRFGWNYPFHLHEDRLEIAYIEKGIAYYKIDMNAVTAKEGEVVIVNPNTLHAVNSSDDYPTRIWVLHMNHFELEGFPANHLSKDQNFKVISLKEHLSFVDCIVKEMKKLYEIDQHRMYGVSQLVSASLLGLLYELQKNKENIIPDSCPEFAKDIMLYLNKNYMKPLTLDDVSTHFHISSSHLSHEFSKYFSISPINYLINRKICEAKWMLISTTMSIENISYELGYDNVSHFKKIFTKRTGCTPMDYRKLYYEKEDRGEYGSCEY